MAESHYSHQTYVAPPAEAQMTPAERERQSEQFKQPGKVRYTPGVGIEYEEVQSSQTATPASEDKSDWFNHATAEDGSVVDLFASGMNPAKVYIPIRNADGSWDRTLLASAISQKLVKKDGAGRWLPFASPESPADAKSQDATKDDKSADEKKDDTTPDQGWSSEKVDLAMATLGREMSESQIEGLVALGLTGAEELSDVRAASIADTLENVSADEVKATYRVMVEEARTAADTIVVKAGVAQPSDLYSWLEQNDLPRAMQIRDSFARGQVKPLQQAAREYVASHGAGISTADEARLLDPNNVVTGGKLWRDEAGVAQVEINGRQMRLREAVRQGFVTVS